MPMPTYDVIVETSAVGCTVLQFLSGVVICRKYIQKKSTGESSGFPFVCGFLSCSLWLRYGIVTGEQSLALVNIIGSTLFFLYTLIYYVFTVNKRSYAKQFAGALGIILAAIFYTNGIELHADKVRVMGLICCVMGICFFAAPLTMVAHVIRVKNSESMPFPLIAMTFVVSVLWVIYGVLKSDTFIQIPNFLGCVLSMMQLSLFVCYPPKSFSGPGYKLLDQTVIY